jgi:hypothetical protein
MYIHAPSGIRTHDFSVRAIESSKLLIPRGHVMGPTVLTAENSSLKPSVNGMFVSLSIYAVRRELVCVNGTVQIQPHRRNSTHELSRNEQCVFTNIALANKLRLSIHLTSTEARAYQHFNTST